MIPTQRYFTHARHKWPMGECAMIWGFPLRARVHAGSVVWNQIRHALKLTLEDPQYKDLDADCLHTVVLETTLHHWRQRNLPVW